MVPFLDAERQEQAGLCIGWITSLNQFNRLTSVAIYSWYVALCLKWIVEVPHGFICTAYISTSCSYSPSWPVAPFLHYYFFTCASALRPIQLPKWQIKKWRKKKQKSLYSSFDTWPVKREAVLISSCSRHWQQQDFPQSRSRVRTWASWHFVTSLISNRRTKPVSRLLKPRLWRVCV